MHDLEFRLALWTNLNLHGAGWVRGVSLQKFASNSEPQERLSHFASQFIRADTAGNSRTISQQMRAVCEVRRCTAKLPARR